MNKKSRDAGWVLGKWPPKDELRQAGQEQQKDGKLILCDRENQEWPLAIPVLLTLYHRCVNKKSLST